MVLTRRSVWHLFGLLLGVIAAGVFVPAALAQVPVSGIEASPVGDLEGQGPELQARLRGIDVSHYQGTINWTSVKNSGVTFAFAKATEGTGYTDPQFRRNWSEMRRVGIIRGAYHFGHPNSDAVAQARRFASAVKSANGGRFSGSLQLVLDLERNDGRSPTQVKNWTVRFINEIKRQTGRPGIIYSGFYFWRDRAGNSTNNLNCPLWLPAYVPESRLRSLIPRAWSTWTFWQYSSHGRVPGISGNVDLDYFNGSITQLRRLVIP